MVSTDIDNAVKPGSRLPLKWSLKPESTIRFDSSAGLSDSSFGISYVGSATSFTVSPVCAVFPALFLLPCRGWLPAGILFVLILLALMLLIELSVLGLFFDRQVTSSASRTILLTSCAELLSLLLRRMLFYWVFFVTFWPRATRFEEEHSKCLKWHPMSKKRRFREP